MFSFEVKCWDSTSSARVGRVTTPHGSFDTPSFMPVGTRGTVKGVTPDQLHATGTQIILGNTYHLMQRPGAAIVRQLGGLAEFSGWRGPTLTDSGGFQVYSLADIRKLTDEGIEFRSHIDGNLIRLDPATAMEVQHQLGADIIMVLDDCPALPCTAERVQDAVKRTLRWAAACRDLHFTENQWLFGIVQGGLDPIQRQHCAGKLVEIGFDGYAVGGLSVGESHEEMVSTLEATTSCLPLDRPRYLMGVGTPKDLLAAVLLGVDMFDCVLPTRNGRKGYAFTAQGPLRLKNRQYADSDLPLEACCDCYCCQNFSQGYLRHLIAVDEILGGILISIHNLSFFQRFMGRLRDLIIQQKPGTIISEFPTALSSPILEDVKESR